MNPRNKSKASPHHRSDSQTSLVKLAKKCGIQTQYRNEAGQLQTVPEESLEEILELMGISPPNLGQSQETPKALIGELMTEPWTELAPATMVIPKAKLSEGWTLSLPIQASQVHQLSLQWTIKPDRGPSTKGRFGSARLRVLRTKRIWGTPYVQFRVPFPSMLALGYYTFQIEARNFFQSWRKTSRLIVTPDSCYLSPGYKRGARLWGLTVQLYGIRSPRNWGIGDFQDLEDIMIWAGRALKAAMVGVNPLHALLSNEVSPYSPSSRLFHNPLYLHIENIPEFSTSPGAQATVASPVFQKTLENLRNHPTVHYLGVKKLKFRVVEKLFKSFMNTKALPKTKRGKAFLKFIHQQGPSLEGFACFQALSEKLAPRYSADWKKWPKAFRSPSSPEVRQWCKQHQTRINFYRYLEWQCVEQLTGVQRTAENIGMPIGLYQDLAVGIDPRGADAWMFQEQLITRATIGTPPELFSPKGQNWGLSPLNPAKLHRHGFEVFAHTFRSLLRHAGLLRLDHAMGLFRMFWIPHYRKPAQGAYVQYPAMALLRILALESNLANTPLVGEDLGTITPLIRQRLQEFGLLSYRLLLFEKTKKGRFIPPHKYPRKAMVSVTTHDLPTLAGFWGGRDIEWKKRLGLFSDPSHAESARMNRKSEKSALLRALKKEGLLPGKSASNCVHIPKLTRDLAQAIHIFLARTPSFLLAISLEDLLGLEETPNIPGAQAREYPVWRIKTGNSESTLEKWQKSKEVLALSSVLKHLRGFQKPGKSQ